jgi:hypothetical protein
MMMDKRNPQANLEYIRDLLSPYLDGEVSDEEQALVEQAIATSAELRQELESLRQTVALVKMLPPVAAPRPFTLTEADVQPVTPTAKKSFWFSRSGWLPSLALLTAAILCVVVIGGYLFSNNLPRSSDVAMAPAMESANVPATVAPQAAEPEAGLAAAEAPHEPAEKEEADAAAPTPSAVMMEKEAPLAEQKVVTEAENYAIEEEAAAPASGESQDIPAEDQRAAGAQAQESVAETAQVTATSSTITSMAAPAVEPAPTLVLPVTPTPSPEAAAAEMAPEVAEEEALTDTADTTAAQPAAPALAEAEDEQDLTLQTAPDQEPTATHTATLTPSPTPAPSHTPTLAPEPTLPPINETASDTGSSSLIGWGILIGVAILVLVGVVVWFKLSRK